MAITLVAIVNTHCTKAIIEEGPGNNNTADTVTYSADIQTVMFNNCLTCHSGASPAAGLDLTTYENVKNSAQSGPLIGRINDPAAPMPTSGLMPESTRQLIDQWANLNYPD